MGISLSSDCCHVPDDAGLRASKDLEGSFSSSSLQNRRRDVSPQQRASNDSRRSNPLLTPQHRPAQPQGDAPPMLSVADTYDVLMASSADDPHSSSSLGDTSGGLLTGSFSRSGVHSSKQPQPSTRRDRPPSSGAVAQRQQQLRGSTFSSTLGKNIPILPPTTYIRDDAPPACSQHRLPIVYPTDDEVLDFVEDDDDIGAVMGERMAGASGGNRRGSLSGSFCSELGGSTSSRRRSRESSVTFNNKTVYAERDGAPPAATASLALLPLSTVEPKRSVQPRACTPDLNQQDHPDTPQASDEQEQQEYGLCYEDDDDEVVFPAHNVFVPSPLKGAPTLMANASLQDGDISLQVGSDANNTSSLATGQWSEAELQPILASPRRERQVVTVHAKTLHQSSLPLSSCEPSLLPPPLHSPTAGSGPGGNGGGSFGISAQDVAGFMMPQAVSSQENLGDSTNPGLRTSFAISGSSGYFDDDFSSSCGRTAKQILLKTMPLETASAKPLAYPSTRRRGTGVNPQVFQANVSGDD
jgi:hypothetical protein